MALINLRNALMAGKRLPYDAEVEFLESTGGQYIDTGVLATQIFGCKLSVEDVATIAYNCFIQNTSTDDFCIGSVNGNTQSSYIRIRRSLTWANNIGSSKTFSIFGGVINANGAQMGTYDSTLPLGANANNIGLFGSPSGARLSKCRIYSCKLYDSNSTLVRDYIPVRVGTVGYLYDRVSGKLFGNAGTGDFVLGQDVVPVEYIESHGTEYIDTGVVGYKTTKVESHCALLNANSAYPAMWGARTGPRNNDFHIYYNTPTIGGNPSSIVLRTGNSDKSISKSDIGVNTFVGTRLDIVAADGALSVNGYNFSTPAFSNFTTPHSILAFCQYSSRPSNFGGFMYWGLKMWQGDNLVRSLQPVRVGNDSTWEGAMMDVLTRRIYRNAGTGAFTFGNDLKYPIPAA